MTSKSYPCHNKQRARVFSHAILSDVICRAFYLIAKKQNKRINQTENEM